jgi:cellulose synthase/poly-beta-1,6-N-acetylglucosamine synthase-like glycosyltransferase
MKRTREKIELIDSTCTLGVRRQSPDERSESGTCTTGITYKTDLTDVTFLVPLRVDSEERKENIDTLIKFTFSHFETNFIILEADDDRKYFPETNVERFTYSFIEDHNEVFHRTKWINGLIRMARTPFVAIFNADVIAFPDQIMEALEMLRSEKAVMSLPYDGRYYACDKITSSVFRANPKIEFLFHRIPVMNLMCGYHYSGGMFIVRKEKYLDAGGENEKIIGLDLVDQERLIRMYILDLPVFYSTNPLFHLWHPIQKGEFKADPEIASKNLKEFLKHVQKKIIIN